MAQIFLNRELVNYTNRSEMYVEFINGSQLWFKSADNPDALRGRGLDFLVVDEAATVKREAWENVLRPSLSDTQGKAVFIGTPKGHNWFFDLWTRGNDPAYTEYKSWTYPSTANPWLSQADIAEAKTTLPDLVFRQEYLAEFLDDYGAVFRGVNECVKYDLQEPQAHKQYVAGCDLAKLVDFMVTIIIDSSTGHVVAFDRFNKLEWPLQRERLKTLVQKYKARLIIDSTGAGEPNLDELRRMNLSVEGYKFTSASKKALVENLSHLIEKQEISFPKIQVLIDELHMFGYKLTEGGVVTYGAPEGYHDDCVIALALAAWQLQRAPAQFR